MTKEMQAMLNGEKSANQKASIVQSRWLELIK